MEMAPSRSVLVTPKNLCLTHQMVYYTELSGNSFIEMLCYGAGTFKKYFEGDWRVILSAMSRLQVVRSTNLFKLGLLSFRRRKA